MTAAGPPGARLVKRISFDTATPSPTARRAALCTVLADITPGAPHERLLLEWFDGVPPPNGAPAVVAEEQVMRGADWLDERRRAGGPRLKHMALAARATGLTPTEFSELWRSRAGKVGDRPIPAVAKGQAYIQNHPVPGDWAYDAVNEVYFDDLADLRARIAFFAEMGLDGESDLVSRATFVAVREEPL